MKYVLFFVKWEKKLGQENEAHKLLANHIFQKIQDIALEMDNLNIPVLHTPSKNFFLNKGREQLIVTALEILSKL